MDQAPYTSPIQPQQPQAPMQQQASVEASGAAKSSVGPVIGAIIVIVLLALGGLYFWGASLNQQPAELPYIPDDGSSMSDSSEAWLPESTGSDDAAAIEAELSATDMDGFEEQMNADVAAAAASLE